MRQTNVVRAAKAISILLLLAWGIGATPVSAQQHATSLQRNLADLVGDSYTILAGKVISARPEPHPQFSGIPTVVVTLEVSDVWKGQANKEFTFRLFVDDPNASGSTLGYKPGQQLLLFLTKPSQYGMSSPAGLDQGKFVITQDAQGNRLVTNGLNNFGLFAKIDQKAPNLKAQLTPQARQVVTQQTSGAIQYDQLMQMVRVLQGSQQ